MNTRVGILRALVVLAAGAALLGLRLPSVGPPPLPILVADVSQSVGPGPFGPPPGVEVALPWYAVADGLRALDARSGAPALGRGATRLSAGLAEVARLQPGRGLWVITDGRATDAGLLDAARRVRAAGGRVDVTPVTPAPADVALLAARGVRRDLGGAAVTVRLAASASGAGEVALLRDGQVVARRDVDLEPDSTREVVLEDREAPARPIAYRVRFTPAPGTPDDEPGNDELALGLRPEQPAVLVWGDLPPGTWAGPAAPFRLRRMAYWEPGALEASDLVIVADVPWSQIGDAHAEALLRFAAGGGRVLFLGGPHAWRAGGWAGTVLEEELAPLRSRRPQGEDLALVFALDRSGSTAQGALDALARAIEDALTTLGPGERMAVLPFAQSPAPALLAPGWVGAGAPEDAAALGAALEALQPGGGTDLAAALLAAGRIAGATQARERRVLLLTDGDPDHPPEPEALAAVRRRLDAIGVGVFAVVSQSPALAQRLASGLDLPPGDVVDLDAVGRVPAALLEVLAKVRGRREVRPGPVRIEGEGGAEAPFRTLAPAAVHALEAHPGASVLAQAVTPDADGPHPFAARRDVGAGAAFALAWGPAFEADAQKAATDLAALAPWIHGLARGADRGLRGEIEGGDLVVLVPEARGAGRVELASPEGPAWLVEAAPGTFRGPMPCECQRGVRVRVPGDGEAWRAVDLPALAPVELRGAGEDRAALEAVARAGGGRVLAPGEGPPRDARAPGAPLAPALLLLALLLLLVERAEAGRVAARSQEQEEHA